MLLAVEIVMLVWGIITLAKGQIKLTSNRTITGKHAYIIGALLTSTVPLIFAIAFVVGFISAMNNPGRPIDNMFFSLVDISVVAIMAILIFIVASFAPKEAPKKQDPFKSEFSADYLAKLPPMGDNPYASPQSDRSDPKR
jgi:hypothetical protein